MATRSHSMAYKHSLCRVCVRQCVGSVCVTPHACFAGSPHTARSATPWPAWRADTVVVVLGGGGLGCIAYV